jgi:hypothetical protein
MIKKVTHFLPSNGVTAFLLRTKKTDKLKLNLFQIKNKKPISLIFLELH